MPQLLLNARPFYTLNDLEPKFDIEVDI